MQNLSNQQQICQVKQEATNPQDFWQQNEPCFVDFGEVYMPETLRISENQYGRCLLSTRNFKKGDLIYRNKVATIGPSVKSFRFVIEGKQYVSALVNSVKLNGDKGRHAYTFDGFSNHSCDPNSVCVVLNEEQDEYEYYATRDIKEGEEVDCNYIQFDYECDGHTFECQCGSPKCYKSIRGFKNLSFVDKLDLLPIMYPMVVEAWLQDNPEIVLIDDLRTPSGLEVCETKGYRKLVARKEFKKGEVICENQPLEIKGDSTLIVKVGEKYEQVDVMSHTMMGEGESRHFMYFGSFINHSCQPNSTVIGQANKLVLFSARDIQAGEEITFDYTTSNAMSDNEEFSCECKSKNCRGVIQGTKKQKITSMESQAS